MGSSYAFIWQNIKQDIFFNGNYSSENKEFDQYLKRFGYTFKNQINELDNSEKKNYMEMIGLKETGLDLLIQKGYKILEQPKLLRHFTAKLEPLK